MKRRQKLELPNSREVVGRYLFTQGIDTWVMYRLSLLGMIFLLFGSVFGLWGELKTLNLNDIFIIYVLQTLLNWPHFMASYKILYLDYRDWRKYLWAMVLIPSLLILTFAIVVWFIINGKLALANNISYLIWLAAAFYLAWHYVGQAWGVISCGILQSRLDIDPSDRKKLYLCTRVMLLWHLCWGVQQLGDFPYLQWAKSDLVMNIANFLAIVSFLLGLRIFHKLYFTNGPIDDRIWGAWLLLYVWYLVIFIEPKFVIFVQLSHALQYMIFPSKIEFSKYLTQFSGAIYSAKNIRSLLLSYTFLLCLGWLSFVAIGYFNRNNDSLLVIAGLIAACINIHHYFTDGAIWKLGDPVIRYRLLRSL
jgi:hypothetical protein